MDAKKKAGFVKLGRKKFAKGGLVRRLGNLKYFDDGGTVLGGPGQVGSNSSATVNNNGLTGTLGNLLGLNNQFQAQGANIQQGTNAAQLNQAYQGAQGGLNQQQAFTDQLGAQGQQGMGTQAALTGQLEGVVNGTGPNAAQMALNQNTSNNVQQQAALMAGQRGAGANAGLLARQAAMQGNAAQQASVGQAATLQAQQQIAAQQQLQSLAGTQIGQQAGAIQGVNNAQQNEQNILQGANTAANNAAVTMQSNINNVNSQVAAANQQQAGNIVGGITGAFGLPLAHGGRVPHLAEGGMPLSVAPLASPGTAGPWLNSSVNSSGPTAVGSPSIALPTIHNNVKKAPPEKKPDPSETTRNPVQENAQGQTLDENGEVQTSGPTLPSGAMASNPGDTATLSGDQGESAGAGLQAAPVMMPLAAFGGAIHHPDPHSYFHAYFSGGETKRVPAMVSAGEVYLSPAAVHKVIHEGANPMKVGEKIKGKAKVKNDSLKNDTIPKTLEEGGVVIPRHITTHKMAPEKAELFVHRAMARKRVRG